MKSKAFTEVSTDAAASVEELLPTYGGEDNDFRLRAFLADLMHWVDHQGLSFDYALEKARGYYRAEAL